MTDTSASHGVTATAVGNGRDSQGRFVKGNRGGPGNPFARRTAALRVALCAAVTEEDVQAIVQGMKEKAKAGDVAAAKLVLGYVVGRAAEVVNPDTLDEAEMQQYVQQPALAAGLPGVLAAPAPELCCDVVRAARPDLVRAMAREMGKAILTGRMPGTGEQICPPLEGLEKMGLDVPESDMQPSGNGGNGTAEVPRKGAGRSGTRASRGRTQRRKTATGSKGSGVSRQHVGDNGGRVKRSEAAKAEGRKSRGEEGARRRQRQGRGRSVRRGKGPAATRRGRSSVEAR